ncbi:MAG: hypothetical protein M3N48_01015 [Verrucomicrobiota bacterium]|nr:hypothetical protein [Verrucomicrobiota bacterium]
MTVFVGCGFAAKYPEGGGNYSVPLQWMLGLRRLGLDAVWLELLPATPDPSEDESRIRIFQRRLHEHGLNGSYCLLHQTLANDAHDLETMRCVGLSRQELLERLAGPNTLLNLSYSLHPPFLRQFERRLFCDLDPSEIFYWMTKIEMGQTHHHEFWTIGLNKGAADCRLPSSSLNWRTFYPLVDTELFRPQPPPRPPMKFTTIGQWYWGGGVEVEGEFPDLSKKFAFEPYLDLPRRIPSAIFELAMNLNRDDPEIARLRARGWRVVSPHRVARTPASYRRYLANAAGEFTAIKGVDVAWRTGWLSDRAAAFLAMGRPVITEDTGAGEYLPAESGFRCVHDLASAERAATEVMADWPRFSRDARACAVELFDSAKNLRKILSL